MRLLSAFGSIIKNLRREYRMVDNLLVEALGLHIVAGDSLVNCYMCNLRQPSIIEGVLSWLCVARWFDFGHNLLYVLADVDDMVCQMSSLNQLQALVASFVSVNSIRSLRVLYFTSSDLLVHDLIATLSDQAFENDHPSEDTLLS